MIFSALDKIVSLSKEQLLEVALDRLNSQLIRDAALQRWLMMDDKDYAASIDRMRRLIREARQRMQGGIGDESGQAGGNTESKTARS